jgi:hypothetical protein
MVALLRSECSKATMLQSPAGVVHRLTPPFGPSPGPGESLELVLTLRMPHS